MDVSDFVTGVGVEGCSS